MALETGQCPQNQGGGKGDNGAAPVAVHPVAEYSEMDQNEDCAEQSPARREPSLKHPKKGGDHGRSGQENADPGIAEKIANRENAGLSRRIDGRVGWLEIDVKGFEIGGHWVRREREATVGEDISLQEIRKFVVDRRTGMWE